MFIRANSMVPDLWRQFQLNARFNPFSTFFGLLLGSVATIFILSFLFYLGILIPFLGLALVCAGIIYGVRRSA